MNLRNMLIAASLMLVCAGSALAAVSTEEAKKLGSSLTAIGAEVAGNADGSIPAYTGGLTTPPASYKRDSDFRTDPFADEKPLFSINAGNMNTYADKLTEASKALLKKYPSFRIDVYKTHRTAGVPNYIQDFTKANAVNAKTTNGGISVQGAKSGFPFPIPKDGYEVMWNHLLRYFGEAVEAKYSSLNVNAAGRAVLSTAGILNLEAPYYNKKNPSTEYFLFLKGRYEAPPRRAGEGLMIKDPLNPAEKGRQAWQYLPGQRRTKRSPEIAFDTPNVTTSGATTTDDSFMFNGSMERFNFKLIGKREMYIPYNAYRMVYTPSIETVLGPKHVNPDVARWELHRVWVVEATLKPGKRHIYSKRIFYLDEDSWVAVASDQYDGRGQLYRGGFCALTQSYDVNAVFGDPTVYYDLVAGTYTFNGLILKDGYVKYVKPLPEKEWSPDALAGSGIR